MYRIRSDWCTRWSSWIWVPIGCEHCHAPYRVRDNLGGARDRPIVGSSRSESFKITLIAQQSIQCPTARYYPSRFTRVEFTKQSACRTIRTRSDVRCADVERTSWPSCKTPSSRLWWHSHSSKSARVPEFGQVMPECQMQRFVLATKPFSCYHLRPLVLGVYFESCHKNIKFVDFCGKFYLPLLQFLCSPTCTSTPTFQMTSSDSDDADGLPTKDMTNKFKKVLLG